MSNQQQRLPVERTEAPEDTDFWLCPFLEACFSSYDDVWEELFSLRGDTAREVKDRHTLRVEIDGKAFYIKRHRGVGWKEILKNLLQGKTPVLGARNEFDGVHAMQKAGIHTLKMAGFGERGLNPAKHQSFFISEELTGWVKLSLIHEKWDAIPPGAYKKFRKNLILAVADAARKMHEAGLNHRDYYLCHLLTPELEWGNLTGDEFPEILVVDLHRMQKREKTPRRWIEKDLAGLYFSSAHWGLTKKEVLLFVKRYTGEKRAADVLRGHRSFWKTIKKRATKLLNKRSKARYVLPFE